MQYTHTHSIPCDFTLSSNCFHPNYRTSLNRATHPSVHCKFSGKQIEIAEADFSRFAPSPHLPLKRPAFLLACPPEEMRVALLTRMHEYVGLTMPARACTAHTHTHTHHAGVYPIDFLHPAISAEGSISETSTQTTVTAATMTHFLTNSLSSVTITREEQICSSMSQKFNIIERVRRSISQSGGGATCVSMATVTR